MASLKLLAFLVAVQILFATSANVSPKLDFEGLDVKKEIKSGKIKGLRVTVDTSELKGSFR